MYQHVKWISLTGVIKHILSYLILSLQDKESVPCFSNPLRIFSVFVLLWLRERGFLRNSCQSPSPSPNVLSLVGKSLHNYSSDTPKAAVTTINQLTIDNNNTYIHIIYYTLYYKRFGMWKSSKIHVSLQKKHSVDQTRYSLFLVRTCFFILEGKRHFSWFFLHIICYGYTRICFIIWFAI